MNMFHMLSCFVVSRFLRAALDDDPLTIHGDGSQTRTFCHINDNLASTARIMENDLHVNATINIGSNEEISILELAKLIKSTATSKSEILHLESLKEGDMTRRLPEISKMYRVLERPLIPLEEGLSSLINNVTIDS